MANNNNNRNMEFREQSNGIDLNVDVVQESRDYSKHFQMCKFWYSMRMNFTGGGSDSMIFVSDLLNVHSDASERIFSIILQTMVESVQLRHFNRKNVIGSDHLQFTSRFHRLCLF